MGERNWSFVPFADAVEIYRRWLAPRQLLEATNYQEQQEYGDWRIADADGDVVEAHVDVAGRVKPLVHPGATIGAYARKRFPRGDGFKDGADQ
jgi:hypothetical protein